MSVQCQSDGLTKGEQKIVLRYRVRWNPDFGMNCLPYAAKEVE